MACPRRCQCGCDLRNRFADGIMCVLKYFDFFAVGIRNIRSVSEYWLNHWCIPKHAQQSFVHGIALNNAMVCAVCAQGGKTGQREGFGTYARCQCNDFTTLMFSEAQDQIIGHG